MKSTLTPIDPAIPLLQLVTYAKDQPEYIPLPTRRTSDGEVVTCWKLNWLARVKMAVSGKLWLTLLTFNNPLQPVRLGVDKPKYMLAVAATAESNLIQETL